MAEPLPDSAGSIATQVGSGRASTVLG